MLPTPDTIDKYIQKHASRASIQRAKECRVEQDFLEDDSAEYTCLGSSGAHYRITLRYAKKLSAHCTCPYNYGGLCKHSVAALRDLADHIRAQNPPPPPRPAAPRPPAREALTYTLTPDQTINPAVIIEDFERHGISGAYHHDNNVTIQQRTRKTLTLRTQDWGEHYEQHLTYDRAKNTLSLRCNCKRKTTYCRHMQMALDYLVSAFGRDYFADDYPQRHLAPLIKEYGFDPDDREAQRLFAADITDQGLKITPRDPALAPRDLFTRIRLPETPPAASDYGYALCIEFRTGQLAGFSVIEGKYDKTRSEITTRIKPLDAYDLEERILKGHYSSEALALYYSTGRIAQNYRNHARPEALTAAVREFADLCRTLPCPVYAHNLDDNYTRAHLTPITLNTSDRVSLDLDISRDGKLYQIDARPRLGDKNYTFTNKQLRINPLFIYHQNTLYPIADPQTANDITWFRQHPQTKIAADDAADFYQNALAPLSQRHQLTNNQLIRPAPPASDAAAPRAQIYLDEQNGNITFRPAVQYPERLIDPTSREPRLQTTAEGHYLQHPRDEALETRLLDTLRGLHPDFAAGAPYQLTAYQLLENHWLLDAADTLRKADIELLGLKNLKHYPYNLNRPTLSTRSESGIDWFDLELTINFGDQHVSLKDLQKAILKKQNYITLGDGSIGLLPQEWLDKIAPWLKTGEIKKDRIRFSAYQFGIIDDLLQNLEERPAYLLELQARYQRLQNLHTQPPVAPSPKLRATLRPYQQHGLDWLAFLHQNRLGGCLADDMGLGKTLQTLAFLQHLKDRGEATRPSLIIAPTSLIYNWQLEAEKFTPDLRVYALTGTDRNNDAAHLAEHDLILTTYGTLVRDIETLQHQPFNYIILDESQAIKNPQSQRYKAVRLLQAHNRLCLTGTPIENNTFDLYAQMNFLNPGLLGNNAHYKSTFADAIDKHKDETSAALLAKLIHPFLLRRTKEQVATELPSKTESILYCDMGAAQRKLYEATKKRYREQLLHQIAADGIEKSQLHILDGLLKLRQICNSPALLPDREDYGDDSAKLDLLLENIKEKTGAHKILVFSSFVKMLGLIQARLDAENIPYEYLDGQTRDRKAKVENFQTNDAVRVFLISTKAGGTGLNLTEADYVFIVDPWWNPAVENQAIDRSHRIGQEKHVMAYRIICKNSIEEKILALQDKKRRIAESIISVDSDKKTFDLEEVKNLFA